MSTTSRIVKNTGYLYAKMAITVLVSFYTTRLVLMALGASDFGVFSVIGGSIAMLSFLSTSMAAATQRFMSYSQGEGNVDKQKCIFNTSIILHLVMAIIVIIMLVALKPVVFNYVLNIANDKIVVAEYLYYFMILSSSITIMSVPYDAVLNAHENMLYYSIVGVVECFLKLSVALFVVEVETNKLLWYGALMALVSIIVAFVMGVYCHRSYDECKLRIREYFDRETMRRMTVFAGWNLLGSSSSLVAGYGSGLVLNHYFGTKLNATNGVVGQVNGQLLAFSNTMLKAVNPVIVKSEGANEREKMFLLSFSSCKMSFFMFAFLAVPFIVECNTILKLWLVDLPPYLVLFCVFGFTQTMVEQLSIPLGTAINAVGNIKMVNILTSCLLYLYFAFLILAYHFGFPAYTMQQLMVLVAICTLLIRVMYCYFKLDMPLGLYLKDVLLRCFVCVMIPFALSYLVKVSIAVEGVIRLAFVLLVSSLSFVVMVYKFGLTYFERMQTHLLIVGLFQRLHNKNIS